MGQPGWRPKLSAMLKKAGKGGFSGLSGVALAYGALKDED
jgi:hypothetical protein